MLRLFIILNLLFFNSLACDGGYDSCKQKVIDSNTTHGQTLEIPVENNKRLIYSAKKPECKILKGDPFLGLYLVEDYSDFEYPFTINMLEPSGIAAINENSAKEGKIVKRQVGLSQLAVFDTHVSSPRILTNSCCSLEGIVTSKGIIEKEYIERFLRVEDTSYADIGINLKDQKGAVVVAELTPSIKNNPFKKEDVLLSIDGTKVENSATTMREILFDTIGSKHSLIIKRDSKLMTIEVESQKKEISEVKVAVKTADAVKATKKVEENIQTNGLQFDKNLKIIKIDEQAKKYGLKLGDKLLQVDGIKITNQQELTKNISSFKNNANLLFERNDFQFFVNVN
ncbi:MAG: PDZ domain-containing protein [Campylobacterales bacterium]|nr:PDZ domain-containing protein [Campylobacterales bacterium]